MATFVRRIAALTLILGAFCWAQSPAGAQYPIPRPGFNFSPANSNVNPALVVAGINQAQYMSYLQAQAAAAARAQAMYAATVALPVYPITPQYPPQYPVGPAVNPYTPVTDPYAATSNPYSPVGANGAAAASYGYNPYYNYIDPASGYLRGQADVMRAYGTVITSQEQARIMREQARQAELDTRKKRFDLDMYIKANTPTYTDEQAKIAKTTLRRIQTMSTESEVLSGKSLNYLLDDVRKYPGKRAAMDPIPLTDDVLMHLNVTKSGNGLGILRNDGKFDWPSALQDLMTPEQMKAVDVQADVLVKSALKGKIDRNLLKDVRSEMDRVRDVLTKKVNEIPTTQYLEAKRFLNDFDAASTALEKGEATTQIQFQAWATSDKKRGKTVQQLAEYMVANGLKFAPPAPADEFAYRAVHSGMAALDVALNTQAVPEAPTEPKDEK